MNHSDYNPFLTEDEREISIVKKVNLLIEKFDITREEAAYLLCFFNWDQYQATDLLLSISDEMKSINLLEFLNNLKYLKG
jgi:hypothetical protein